MSAFTDNMSAFMSQMSAFSVVDVRLLASSTSVKGDNVSAFVSYVSAFTSYMSAFTMVSGWVIWSKCRRYSVAIPRPPFRYATTSMRPKWGGICSVIPALISSSVRPGQTSNWRRIRRTFRGLWLVLFAIVSRLGKTCSPSGLAWSASSIQTNLRFVGTFNSHANSDCLTLIHPLHSP